MPKLFEYTCDACEEKREEMFNQEDLVDHLPPDKVKIECKSCKSVQWHTRVTFSRNPHREHVTDSPYGGKVRG
jgi:hypothetical protein